MSQPRFRMDHVQITVPGALETETRRFYGEGLGFPEIPKPPALARNGGMWYQLGDVQLHVSLEDVDPAANGASRRHIAYDVADVDALEAELRRRGLAIIPDRQPTPGLRRFYLRDPGGNRLEISQKLD
ncbi:MAG TPA: VOC family protein [Stellaceae bacterium]|nr:VOC family protein [Stellaceae bacterium]